MFTKGRTIFVVMLMVVFAATAVIAQEQLKIDPNMKVKKPLVLKLSADVQVVAFESSPCLCFDDVMRYFKSISPKRMSVHIWNNSKVRVNTKLTLKYRSYYRKPGKIATYTRNVVLEPNQSKNILFWNNTYYDIIDVRGSRNYTAELEITDTNITDPDPSNNKRSSQRCEVYVY